MLVVTGAAGFIGSNLIKALNNLGISNILAIDNLQNGIKFRNLVGLDIADFMDKTDFIENITKPKFKANYEAIIHNGACSDTTEWNGHYMMKNNYEYSKVLLQHSIDHNIPFLYASSAAVYGASKIFREHPDFEAPLNVYGYSKILFDQWVRKLLPTTNSQIAGFRYFNVYGPREQHKGTMASVAYHFNNQVIDCGEMRLFAGSDGYGDGEQLRDFVFVDDVNDVILWFLDHPEKTGIFNIGTGHSQRFKDVANAVKAYHGRGEINYIPFPEHLKGSYQSYTQADISALREAGYDRPFKTVEEGVAKYMMWLNAAA